MQQQPMAVGVAAMAAESPLQRGMDFLKNPAGNREVFPDLWGLGVVIEIIAVLFGTLGKHAFRACLLYTSPSPRDS